MSTLPQFDHPFYDTNSTQTRLINVHVLIYVIFYALLNLSLHHYFFTVNQIALEKEEGDVLTRKEPANDTL